MTRPRMGELFAGYGGLGMGVQAALGAAVAWVSEYDKGPNKILAHRFPDVPNLGDITRIDWATVEPVDILTGGSPCQDLSHAGKRQGMTEGTRSNLWVAMREAIAALRPGLVVWENVRGAYSADAASGLVDDPRLLADTRRRDGEPVLRALGRVLGDLSDLGYDAQWHGLRAADVGAPHGRFRVFVVAHPGGARRQQLRAIPGRPQFTAPSRGEQSLLLPTPVADNSRGLPSTTTDFSSLPNVVCSLLPTPAVNDMGEGKTVEAWDEWTAKMKAAHGNGNGHGASLSIEAQRLAVPSSCTCGLDDDPEWPLPEDMWGNHDINCPAHQRLLPTPSVADTTGGRKSRSGERSDELLLNGIAAAQQWGQYAAAIHRWETLTRPAPPPTETGPKGNPRLSAAFSEWMQGLPAGWVTDVPGITRNEALKALGNGVVPAQAAAALRIMLRAEAVA